ncbi:hypothetical protein PspLS_07851 [Pyricularia sp. CBS 133598]|nr:hypothetical protein PspLS_07851 [Pyricularia sp. CBS 133598]
MEAHEELINWAEAQGIVLSGVRPDRIPGRGIGIIASRKVKADETVLRVPTTALRTKFTVPKEICKALPKNMTVHGLLAADLALEDSGKYDEWNAVLPTPEDVRTMPFTWAPALQALLPTRAAELLAKQEEKFAKDWEAVSLSPLSKKPSRDSYRYAWLLANTRTFYFVCPRTERLGKEDRMVLQPVADLFNHADAGCAVAFNDEDFTIRADRDYDAGDEVLICYGNHSNDFLLAEYGFVLAANRWDEVCIDDAVLPLLTKAQRELLKERNFLGNYMLDAATVCYRTEVALRLVCSPNEESWHAFVDGFEDASVRGKGAAERMQSRVDRLLLKALTRYRDEIIDDRCEALEDDDHDYGPGLEEQTELLLRRWKQISSLVNKEIKRLGAKLA